MRWTTYAALIVLLGCGEAAATTDAESPGDGGAQPVDDAGRDGAVVPSDASLNLDGRVLFDAGALPDGATTTPDAGNPPVAGPWRVYVNVGGERRLAVVDVEIDGSMTERSGMAIQFDDVTGAMAHDPVRSRLYVGLSPTGFATISLNAAGEPSLDGTTNAARPVFLSVSPDGRYLLSAYFSNDDLRVHDVAGNPMHEQTERLDVGDEPHAIRRGPNGLYYVPHRGENAIFWLRLEANGELTKVGEISSRGGPRHIAFHPDGSTAYVVNEIGDSVTAFSIGTDGSLSRLGEDTTLPMGVDGSGNSCADIHITPDGRFVYASNRGHDSIARFEVLANRDVRFLGTTDTEQTPREFEMTPDGTLLLALGQGSGRIQSYTVGNDGNLSRADRVAVGSDLRWAIALQR